jgi:broad specificity phosphatase PhoE
MRELFTTLPGRGNIFFLRHGESEGNDARVIQGREDFPLSAAGRKQAQQVAAWFTDKRIDTVLSSPLKRAAQTARIIASVLGVEDVKSNEGLQEMGTGIFTGMSVAEIQQRYPEAWSSFQRLSWEGVPEAERVEELYSRARSLWMNLAEIYRGGRRNILCVTHSGILQWIIKATFGQQSWMPIVPIGNCGICQFSLDNDIDSQQPRSYFEWSHLNYQPIEAIDSRDHLFLER